MAQDQAAPEASRLDRLLSLAGPANRDELLTRLREDLDRSAAALATALATGDRAGVRAQTHILISVAGAVGADRLSSDARALNDAAHGDQPLPAALGAQIAGGVRDLLALIASRAVPGAA